MSKRRLVLAAAENTVLGLSGSAALAPLLPAEVVPLAGDRVALSLRAKFDKGVAVDPLSIETAAGKVSGGAAFGAPDRAISAHLRADLPELIRLAGVLGQPLEGSATLDISLAGTESRPELGLTFSGSDIRLGSSGAQQVETDIRVVPTGTLDDPATRIEFAAKGRIKGIVVPEGVTVPPELGRDIDWQLAGNAARDGRSGDLIGPHRCGCRAPPSAAPAN